VSGVATKERRVNVTEQEVKGFFPKPIDWDELVGYLYAIIGKKYAEINFKKRFKLSREEENIWG
jgi:hypothetical protein